MYKVVELKPLFVRSIKYLLLIFLSPVINIRFQFSVSTEFECVLYSDSAIIVHIQATSRSDILFNYSCVNSLDKITSFQLKTVDFYLITAKGTVY